MFAILYVLMTFASLIVSPTDYHGKAPPGTESHSPSTLPRRQSYIPVHYVTGCHYEVGVSVGRVYANMIQQYVKAYGPLKDLLAAYATPKGKKIYQDSLDSCRRYFPQYVIEMEGMADGSGVPFEQLFIITLDDTLLLNVNDNTPDPGPIGCTSILVNQDSAQFLGHTEDSVKETVNNYIILAAHVIPSEREKGGIFAAREEKFEALTYVAHLSGYASGHNMFGLIFSVNQIFVSKPLSGRIPREIVCRALLAARADLEEIMFILINPGCGTANGFNVNLGFLNNLKGERELHTVEVVPDPTGPYSNAFLTRFPMGFNSLHTNRLLHLKYPELNQDGYHGSLTRENRYKILTGQMPNDKITNLAELLTVLGNQDDMGVYPIFGDSDTAYVNTINLGVFDFEEKTWTMWCNDPLRNQPLLQLPLTFKDLIYPTLDELIINNIKDVQPVVLNDKEIK
ncbi:Peptidase C45 [Cinara cedri]|uniref:Peptidase C45 n=1 Tax=Cinara cedri TaxID=506608 RepID=A0A5E4NG33_9HEMI|nr:Peptidase C45 [Cinara cedri]